MSRLMSFKEVFCQGLSCQKKVRLIIVASHPRWSRSSMKVSTIKEGGEREKPECKCPIRNVKREHSTKRVRCVLVRHAAGKTNWELVTKCSQVKRNLQYRLYQVVDRLDYVIMIKWCTVTASEHWNHTGIFETYSFLEYDERCQVAR